MPIDAPNPRYYPHGKHLLVLVDQDTETIDTRITEGRALLDKVTGPTVLIIGRSTLADVVTYLFLDRTQFTAPRPGPVETPERITRVLAALDPKDATYGFCTLCESGTHGAPFHARSCPWLQAVEWVASHPAPDPACTCLLDPVIGIRLDVVCPVHDGYSQDDEERRSLGMGP